MIKGVSTEGKFLDGHHVPLFFQDLYKNIQIQPDTISKTTVKSISSGNSLTAKLKVNLLTDSISFNSNKVDKLFNLAAARDKDILKVNYIHRIPRFSDTTQFHGSTKNIFNEFAPSFPHTRNYPNFILNNNFLLKIQEKSLHQYYHDESNILNDKKVLTVTTKPNLNNSYGIEGRRFHPTQNGWYVIIILLILALFTYCKTTYRKYIFQVIESTYNFQLSERLFRDKNILFRNLSIILQILFSLIIGIFVTVSLYHFQYKQVFDSLLLNILLYSSALYFFFLFKNFLYLFLGLVFKNQEDFSEISHHISMFNKVIGIFLLPIVVILPFINYKFQLLLIYLACLVFLLLTILLLIRSFQIVANKQISFFFLILYLCTIEILPVLIIIKASKTII
jgi:hypothetical protein